MQLLLPLKTKRYARSAHIDLQQLMLVIKVKLKVPCPRGA